MSRGDQLRRQWLILDELARGRVSRRALAERLDVSRKTITRDLEALSMFPIVEERDGVDVYYQLLRGAKPPPLRLEPEELAALLLSQRTLLAALEGAPQRDAAAAALDKLALLPREHGYRRARALPEVFFSSFDKPEVDDGRTAERQRALQDAALRRRRVWLDYYTPERQRARARVVEPYVVHLHPRGLHLIAYCLERQAFMYFNVHCVRALRVLDETFDAGARGFALEEFLGTVFDGQRGSPVIDVHLRVRDPTARWARALHYHRSQTVEEREDGVEIRFRAGPQRAVAARALSLGPDCEVISPESLRAEVASLARRVLARHERPGGILPPAPDPGPDLSRVPDSVPPTPDEPAQEDPAPPGPEEA